MERQARVLIADDQGPTRQGLRALLTLCPQVEVVGEAIDGREAVNMAAKPKMRNTRRGSSVLMGLAPRGEAAGGNTPIAYLTGSLQ